MAGNVGAYRRLLVKFADNQATVADDIRKAAAAGDWELAKRLAHTLKGVAGNISAKTLSLTARNLEEALSGEVGRDSQIAALIASVGAELDRIVAAVRAGQPAMPTTASGSIEKADLLPRLLRLRAMLTQYDSESEDLLLAILDETPDQALRDSLDVLDGFVSRYDFDGAVTNLDTVIARIAESV